MQRLISFARRHTQPIAFAFALLTVVGVAVGVFISSQGGDSRGDDQEQPVAELQLQQGPHENDPGFTLRFTDQPRPKNPTPLEYCEFAVAVDPDLEMSTHEVSELRGRGLEFVNEEIIFLGGTRVITRRSGFSNPHTNYRVNYNWRILRADGTATLAHYGFAGGGACVVSEWREWDADLPYVIDAHKASETLYFPGGAMVRITMEPDYTREYPAVSPATGYTDQEVAEFPPKPGANLTSASIISRDGVVTEIPISEQITTVYLDIWSPVEEEVQEVRVEIGLHGDRVDIFAYP